jgi:putative lipoprotein (rSAM/lipoprotein system)
MKTSKIITGLLALLGFSGCGLTGCKQMYAPNSEVMYMPLIVEGVVTDAEEKPIENIRVVLKIKGDEQVGDLQAYRDTVYTDSQGQFKTGLRPEENWQLELIATDIDGAENGGEFEGVTKEFATSEGERNDGEFVRVKEVDFTLELKPQQEDENE